MHYYDATLCAVVDNAERMNKQAVVVVCRTDVAGSAGDLGSQEAIQHAAACPGRGQPVPRSQVDARHAAVRTATAQGSPRHSTLCLDVPRS